jgi:hypothetical protein
MGESLKCFCKLLGRERTRVEVSQWDDNEGNHKMGANEPVI